MELEWIKNIIAIIKDKNIDENKYSNIWDKIFDNEINKQFVDCHKYYKQMNFHCVITCFNNMLGSRDKHRSKYDNNLIPIK